MSKNLKKKKLQRVYDILYKNERDSLAANIFLLVLQIENFLKRKGFGVSFGNLRASGIELDQFMFRNRLVLISLFIQCFSDPFSYSWTGNFSNKKLNFLLGSMNFSKKLGSSLVDGVTLEPQKGETLGLVGESGCGSTELARTILHLIEDGEKNEIEKGNLKS